jgi:hypothetical protein
MKNLIVKSLKNIFKNKWQFLYQKVFKPFKRNSSFDGGSILIFYFHMIMTFSFGLAIVLSFQNFTVKLMFS